MQAEEATIRRPKSRRPILQLLQLLSPAFQLLLNIALAGILREIESFRSGETGPPPRHFSIVSMENVNVCMIEPLTRNTPFLPFRQANS